MKGTALGILLILTLCAYSTWPSSALADVTGPGEPALVSAELITVTGDKKRDNDSCLTVIVKTADMTKDIARAQHTECQGQYGYDPRSKHAFQVPLVATTKPFTKAQCQHFQYQIGFTPNGNNTWTFDAWLVLHFSDGSMLWNDKLHQSISAGADAFGFNDTNPPPK